MQPLVCIKNTSGVMAQNQPTNFIAHCDGVAIFCVASLSFAILNFKAFWSTKLIRDRIYSCLFIMVV